MAFLCVAFWRKISQVVNEWFGWAVTAWFLGKPSSGFLDLRSLFRGLAERGPAALSGKIFSSNQINLRNDKFIAKQLEKQKLSQIFLSRFVIVNGFCSKCFLFFILKVKTIAVF